MEGQGSTGAGGSGSGSGSAGSDGKRRRESSDEESSSNKKVKAEEAVQEEAVQEEEEEEEEEVEEEEVVGGQTGDPETVMAGNVIGQYVASIVDLTDDCTVCLTEARATEMLGVKGLNRTFHVLAENTRTWIPLRLECRRAGAGEKKMTYQVLGEGAWKDWIKAQDADDDSYVIFCVREGSMLSVRLNV